MEGIERFRTAKYAANHSTGFIIGYLTADDAKASATGINCYLIRKSRSAESLMPSNLVGTSWAWRSSHPRAAGSLIELHHAFLSFVVP